jgi:hypothetical protein
MKRVILLGSVAFALAGCSTVTEGTRQNISVNTTPPGANCTFMRQGASLGSVNPTPGTLKIRKLKYDISVECEKPGYQKVTAMNHSSVAAATFGNILIGGVAGWIVDSATGSDNKYDSVVNLTMTPVATTSIAPVAPMPMADASKALTN